MTRTLKIIGVDPGKMTGVALLEGTHFQSWELPALDAVSFIKGHIIESRHIEVVCERFVIGANTVKKTRQADATEIGGTLRHFCGDYPGACYSLQMASDAKKAGNHTTLRAFGWFTPGKNHANDAAAHVAMRLLRLNPVRFYDMLHPGKI